MTKHSKVFFFQFFSSKCITINILDFVLVWEIATGRCLKTIEVKGTVRCVAWCPNSSIALVAAAVDQFVYLINPGVGDRLVRAKTDEILKEIPAPTENLSKYL